MAIHLEVERSLGETEDRGRTGRTVKVQQFQENFQAQEGLGLGCVTAGSTGIRKQLELVSTDRSACTAPDPVPDGRP